MTQKLKQITLLSFAVIGILSLLIYVYQFLKAQDEAADYGRNCRHIKVGMTVSEAKKIMGDSDWFNQETRSEIWIENNADSTNSFYLSYPGIFGGSEWPMIYFDPNTMIVTKVTCGG